jgi:glutaredoxin 3
MALIEIYTSRFCGYCQSAKSLLKRKGVAFTEIDVTGDPKKRAKMIERANGGYTVPQIFIGTTHVGGADELHALERAAELEPLLVSEGITTKGPSA